MILGSIDIWKMQIRIKTLPRLFECPLNIILNLCWRIWLIKQECRRNSDFTFCLHSSSLTHLHWYFWSSKSNSFYRWKISDRHKARAGDTCTWWASFRWSHQHFFLLSDAETLLAHSFPRIHLVKSQNNNFSAN